MIEREHQRMNDFAAVEDPANASPDADALGLDELPRVLVIG